MMHITLPTLDQIKAVAVAASEVLGATSALCTAIGNPLAKYTSGKLASFGHLVLSFGIDIGKARKRISDLFSAPSDNSPTGGPS